MASKRVSIKSCV